RPEAPRLKSPRVCNPAGDSQRSTSAIHWTHADGSVYMNLSIVDISVVQPGETRHEALQHSIELARRAEEWGFQRYWVAEHHGARAVAGRAPEVLIAAIAARTSTIRVGSGSVLLNHYSPL